MTAFSRKSLVCLIGIFLILVMHTRHQKSRQATLLQVITCMPTTVGSIAVCPSSKPALHMEPEADDSRLVSAAQGMPLGGLEDYCSRLAAALPLISSLIFMWLDQLVRILPLLVM